MKARDGRSRTGDEADGIGIFPRGNQIGPERLRNRTIVNVNVPSPLAFEREDDILIFHVLGPEWEREAVGRPSFQEMPDGLQTGIVCVSQNSQMEISICNPPGFSTLSFRGAHSQNKGCIVPKKERLGSCSGPLEGC